VEINITRQHVWFYKNGKLITQGDVVTGDPNKGYSTNVGTYMLNYKEKESTLRGANYEAKVTYWMPFNGNIGIHDASWRYSFGGEIYKRNGTHGCINSPLYLAKAIFENIEEGTPIICYEE
jgi:lipoprotein-anchoring transpeptidase ErfK/SrfK